MKWRNIDVGNAAYYITGTVTEWLPLLNIAEVRQRVCDDIQFALDVFGGKLLAFVVMPTHVHLLVHLAEEGLLHGFNKRWRGRSGRHIPKILERLGRADLLGVLAAHANGGCRYASWKEQTRDLGVISGTKKLLEKIEYIHANPVRRGLVEHPGDWLYSSWRFYERGEEVCLPVTPFEL